MTPESRFAEGDQIFTCCGNAFTQNASVLEQVFDQPDGEMLFETSTPAGRPHGRVPRELGVVGRPAARLQTPRHARARARRRGRRAGYWKALRNVGLLGFPWVRWAYSWLSRVVGQGDVGRGGVLGDAHASAV
jgi:hypothetical protein